MKERQANIWWISQRGHLAQLLIVVETAIKEEKSKEINYFFLFWEDGFLLSWSGTQISEDDKGSLGTLVISSAKYCALSFQQEKSDTHRFSNYLR